MTAGSAPPRRRTAAWIAMAIGATGVGMLGVSLWLHRLNGSPVGIDGDIPLIGAFYTYLAVGLVLIARRPRNSVGWLLAGIGVMTSLMGLAEEYAAYAFSPAGSGAPGAYLASWFLAWSWFPTITAVFLLLPLLFPSGRPTGHAARVVLWVAAPVMLATAVLGSLNPALRGDTYRVANPIGVAAVGDVEKSTAGSVLFGVLVVCMLASLVLLIRRFRRSRGAERQQLKWFVFAAATIVLLALGEEMLTALHVPMPSSDIPFAVSLAFVPVAIGIAVLKYRLYDIDRIISRTLTYALLSALLLGVYLGVVTAMTAIIAPVTRDSSVAVAAATLLVAAAFQPARRRIQGVVDRRFNRARYDAARTVDNFRAVLRDEIDLASITESVHAAVEKTVQPARTLVWLREERTT